MTLFIASGMLVAALIWPRMALSLVGVLDSLAAALRDHSVRLDRAYRAYCEEPEVREAGLDRHWRSVADEVTALERMVKK